jgi:hypothetical protein
LPFLPNYHGRKLYDVAKACMNHYLNLPGQYKNRKKIKIVVCFNGHDLCVDRKAAGVHIKNGATLGGV